MFQGYNLNSLFSTFSLIYLFFNAFWKFRSTAGQSSSSRVDLSFLLTDFKNFITDESATIDNDGVSTVYCFDITNVSSIVFIFSYEDDIP